MKATQLLHDLGQSIWLDNLTRELVKSGALLRYINEFSVSGLTSNATIFDHATKKQLRLQRLNSAPALASTGTKDPKASNVLYIKALAPPFTVNTMPESTLKALAEHTSIGPPLSADGGDSEQVLAEFAKAGVNVDSLAAQLQDEGARSLSPGTI